MRKSRRMTKYIEAEAVSEIRFWRNTDLANMADEGWIDVKGVPDYYQISTYGRLKVKPHSRFYAADFNYPERRQREKKYDWMIKKQVLSPTGYLNVFLNGYVGKLNFVVSRIVAENFIPNPENKPFVNHKNGIRWDNRLENLEWVTKQENETHAWKVLNRPSTKGEIHAKAKLKESDIFAIRKRYDSGERIPDIHKDYNNRVSHSVIWSIAKKRTWRHLL